MNEPSDASKPRDSQCPSCKTYNLHGVSKCEKCGSEMFVNLTFEEKEFYSCKECTFLQSVKKDKCEMCGTAR